MNLKEILILLAHLDVILSGLDDDFFKEPKKPKPTSIIKHPYHVKVYTVYLDSCSRQSFKRCGGAILSKNVVITAAHCLKEKFKSTILHHFIEYGTAFKDMAKGKQIEVKDILTRRDYDICNGNDADVALLVLKNPIRFSRNAQPIKPNYYRLPTDKLAETIGFAYIINDFCLLANKTHSPILHAGTLSVISKFRCEFEYKKITKNQFCAGFSFGGSIGDACQGEAGALLVYKEELIGIASYGEGCSKFGSPRVYSSIKAMRKLIKSTLKRYSKK